MCGDTAAASVDPLAISAAPTLEFAFRGSVLNVFRCLALPRRSPAARR
jgi:hypothetical protein